MKKKVLKFALAAILGVVVSYTVYSSKTDVSLSDLALENVEALADGESGDNYKTCHTGSAGEWAGYGLYSRYCGSCTLTYVDVANVGDCRLW